MGRHTWPPVSVAVSLWYKIQSRRCLLAGFIVICFGALRFLQLGHAQALTPARIVDDARMAHGLGAATVNDVSSEGTLTIFTMSGEPHKVPMVLLRKGPAVQRSLTNPDGEVRQGTDGAETWLSFGTGKLVAKAPSSVREFIKSQTVRSTERLFKYANEGLVLRDLGVTGKGRVIEAEDRQGRKTTYFIQDGTYVISQLEFVTGTARDAISGKTIVLSDRYEFSDFRVVQGVLTPFVIERYQRSRKTEELRFNTVRYNTGIADAQFRP